MGRWADATSSALLLSPAPFHEWNHRHTSLRPLPSHLSPSLALRKARSISCDQSMEGLEDAGMAGFRHRDAIHYLPNIPHLRVCVCVYLHVYTCMGTHMFYVCVQSICMNACI